MSGANPQVAVMILPGITQKGMLEDVCLESKINANDPAMPCLDDYFNCLSSTGITMPTKMSKAKMHAFLASRPEPDLRLYESAEKTDYWDWGDPAFGVIRDFLQLFHST